MRKIIFFLASVIIFLPTQAQISINDDGRQPDPTAGLDVSSTNKVALLPRMTMAQLKNIPAPANSLVVFCTTDNKIYSYIANENGWKEILYGALIPRPAEYTIGFSDSCGSFSQTEACYYKGDPLTPFHRVVFRAQVLVPGQYIVYSDTINGYSFLGSGIWENIGEETVTLVGRGTPIAASLDHFTAKQSDSNGTCYFTVKILAPGICDDMGTVIDPRDGKVYHTAQVGDQCWLKENLNVGTRIPSNQEQQDNGIMEKYCYKDLESNCDTYGGLYQWDEVMQYVNIAGTQGICPPGWHVPSFVEGKNLFMCIGIENPEITYFNAVQNDAGGKLKEFGFTYWKYPNSGGSNVTGFTGLGSGYIAPSLYPGTPSYPLHINENTSLWLSETCLPYWIGTNPPPPDFYALWISLDYKNASTFIHSYGRYHAFPLRCIRD
jgi:uncharacterized protein (TIGR02145 family)